MCYFDEKICEIDITVSSVMYYFKYELREVIYFFKYR